MSLVKIKSALVSVYSKVGLEPIIREFDRLGVKIYSTGGTQSFIENLGVEVSSVESLTGYPSILDGRVKTLHPMVFGGLLARRENTHLAQLEQYFIPEIDCLIVDLYPFEQTVATTNNHDEIIEKIDIGGVSLIRAAAKNYHDVVVIPSQNEYDTFLKLLRDKNGFTGGTERKAFARRAFSVTSHYDTAIFHYFMRDAPEDTPQVFKQSIEQSEVLRYGENPHQTATFFGNLNDLFDTLSGKKLSYNNLVDVDAAVQLMREFKHDEPTFAILKHTNACGIATRPTVKEAWDTALSSDPVSAFGGILICNRPIDLETAQAINKIFYEVLIAPAFDADAQALLTAKKGRILLKIKDFHVNQISFKSLLNGVIQQDSDLITESRTDLTSMTERKLTDSEIIDTIYAIKCVKHLKSNGISIVKNRQLLAMGCGQTSRVDSLQQALAKAAHMGFDVKGAAMASEAFFPFADCVEIAHKAGITAVAQPGGSINDQKSIDSCNENDIAMVMTGIRHFKH